MALFLCTWWPGDSALCRAFSFRECFEERKLPGAYRSPLPIDLGNTDSLCLGTSFLWWFEDLLEGQECLARDRAALKCYKYSLIILYWGWSSKQIAVIYTHDLSMVLLLINVPSCPEATDLSLNLSWLGYEEKVSDSMFWVVNFFWTRRGTSIKGLEGEEMVQGI